MYQVLDDSAVCALKLPPGRRYAVVELTPGADGSWGWLAALHHDIDGALRGFRYLAQKAKAAYDPADPRGRNVAASIDRHLATVESLKAALVDRLFPVA